MSLHDKMGGVLERERAFLTKHVLRNDHRRALLLVLPVTLFLVHVFLAPMLFLIRMSLYERNERGAYTVDSLSVESYAHILSMEYIHGILLFTAKYAIVTTVLIISLSMIFAYVIWRASPGMRTLYLSVTILALFATLVVKAYALLLLVSPEGTFNSILLFGGVVSEPIRLVSNEIGAILGQVYIVLPYGILVIYGILSTLDEDVFHAASDLGAPDHRIFIEIVIPHMVPGIVVATVISLAWGFGAFTAPLILGGGSEQTFAILVQNLLLTRFDWPVAAATSLIMLVVILSLLVAMMAFLNRIAGANEYV